MKRKIFLVLCTLPLWANAQQTVQVLDSVVSYLNGNNGAKYEYQYDEKAIAISETYCYWNSSSNTWVKNSKCEYQYDDNNNKTWITFYWNGSTNKWAENKKREYLYNSDKNQAWITFYWNNSSNKWVENKKCEYQYDDNQTIETCYSWDNGAHAWIKTSTAQYNYYYSSMVITGISPPTNTEQSATIFPNPATNHITVKATAESIITVTNISGIIIYKQVMTDENTTIDVSSWVSGVYIISVETGNNRTVSKIIKS